MSKIEIKSNKSFKKQLSRFKNVKDVNNQNMIKSRKTIKLTKHFVMQYSVTKLNPSFIKDTDIYAMFTGLLSMVQTNANNKANRSKQDKELSYKHLLEMYRNAVKNMNKYKALYLKTIHKKNVTNCG